MKLPTYEDQGGYKNPNNGGARFQDAPRIDTRGDRFGAQNWAEVGKLGQQIQQAAGQVGNIYDDYNTTKANEAANTFQRDFLAWQSEASQKKGKFGQDVGEEYAQWSQKRLSALGKDLNNVQKGRFMSMAQDSMATQQRWAADYGNGEKKNYQLAEYQAGIDVQGETIIANIGDPEMVAKAVAIQKNLAFSMAQTKGLGEEATMQLMQDAPQKYLSSAVENIIKSGDTGTASGMLEQYAPEIGAGNVGKLQALLKSERKRQEKERIMEVRAARAEQREMQREYERVITRDTIKDIMDFVKTDERLATPEEKIEAAYKLADAVENPDIRDNVFSNIEREVRRMGNAQDATVSRQKSQFLEATKANGWTDNQALDFLGKATNIEPKAKEFLEKHYQGQRDQETPEKVAAANDIMGLITAGAENGGIDPEDETEIRARAEQGGLTPKQTEKVISYAKEGGAAGKLTVTQVRQAYEELNPGKDSKKMPPDYFTLIEDEIKRSGHKGEEVTVEEVKTMMSDLELKGRSKKAGFLGGDVTESRANALRNERLDKWEQNNDEAEKFLSARGYEPSEELIEGYNAVKNGGTFDGVTSLFSWPDASSILATSTNEVPPAVENTARPLATFEEPAQAKSRAQIISDERRAAKAEISPKVEVDTRMESRQDANLRARNLRGITSLPDDLESFVASDSPDDRRKRDYVAVMGEMPPAGMSENTMYQRTREKLADDLSFTARESTSRARKQRIEFLSTRLSPNMMRMLAEEHPGIWGE